MHDFNALSLFSGCGGDTLGMNNSYINVKWYSELSKKFRASHDMNFKDCECLGGDITEISDEAFESLNGKCDVVFGGFPCQSFSQAGKKCATDPRGQLYLHFVRAVKCVQPKFFIGENVKGLLTRVTSDGRKFIDVIVEAFKEIGYTCEYKLFKCNEHGTPQKRERVILIGWKNGEKYNHKWVRPDKKETTLENVVEFDMEGAVEVPKAVFDQIGVPETSILSGEGSPTGAPHPYVRRAVERGILSFGKRSAHDAVEVVDFSKPSKTITSSYGWMPRLLVAQRVAERYYVRTYTIRELKLIQGFPETHELYGNLREQQVQLGNAVPAPLIKRIGMDIWCRYWASKYGRKKLIEMLENKT